MVAKIILKNGTHIDVRCRSFTVNYGISLRPVSIDFIDAEENKPLYIDEREIAAIVRVYHHERQF